MSEGWFLLLLSPDALDSAAVRHEASYALERSERARSGNFIPIVVSDDETISSRLAAIPGLEKLPLFVLTEGRFEADMLSLIKLMKDRDL
jgi:hypothetical protein